MKRVIWYLVAGSRGGINRVRIIDLLHDRPSNAHQIAETLDLDYKTVRHHLKVMTKNRVVTSMGDGYGMMYFLTDLMEENYGLYEEIVSRLDAEVG